MFGEVGETALLDDSIEMVMGCHLIKSDSYPDNLHYQTSIVMPMMKVASIELQSNQEVSRRFYLDKSITSTHVWNKLLKLSFVKSNHLYNREGILWEDSLWTFYLIRSLKHAVFIRDITYLYYTRPGSISSQTDYKIRLEYQGYIHQEIANLIEPERRKEEADFWIRNFCRYYIDASDNTIYKNAMNSYRINYSVDKNQNAFRLLRGTEIISKSIIGHFFLRIVANNKTIRSIGRKLLSKGDQQHKNSVVV